MGSMKTGGGAEDVFGSRVFVRRESKSDIRNGRTFIIFNVDNISKRMVK